MEAKEFEELLSDVETRMDRLRALYENWFRGYEKLEPMTARKDVERRVYQLRKDLPRNTGLRFRYNTLFQRYTTMTTYWARTAKQIEEGTYRLQLQRLRRKNERQNERQKERAAARPREKGDSDRPAPHQGYELNLDEQLDVRDLLDDSELDAVARAMDEPGPNSVAPFAAPQRAAPAMTFAKPVERARAGGPNGMARAMSESSSYSEPPPADDFADPPTAQASLPNAQAKAPHARAPSASLPKPHAPSASLPKPPSASLPKPPPLPPMPSSPRAPLGNAGNAGMPRSLPVGGMPRVPAPPTPSAASPSSASGERSEALGEQRMKSLYDEYTSARRKNNEGEVRYDALVSSIQKMLPELQKKHAGKQIDFEIVLKDGRVGLRPKAK